MLVLSKESLAYFAAVSFDIKTLLMIQVSSNVILSEEPFLTTLYKKKEPLSDYLPTLLCFPYGTLKIFILVSDMSGSH